MRRPFGGISILWKKALGLYCKVIQFDDDRLFGLSIKIGYLRYLFLNVYLPYYSADNYGDYDMYMGKIATIIDDSDAAGVVIMGDFNACPRKPNDFYCELQHLCNLKDLFISDVNNLPQDTFTHVNNGSLTRSWLDHCLTSASLQNVISNITVNNDYHGSDHFPLHVTFYVKDLPRFQKQNDSKSNKVNWNFSNPDLNTIFYAILWQRIDFNPRHPACSCEGGCSDAAHLNYLDSLWANFIRTAEEVGREVFGTIRNKRRCIPGWNTYIKDFYHASREAFALWRDSGSPRFGPLACAMRTSRANFKYALRQCHLHEEELRAEALSSKLQNGEVVPFWRDIQSLRGGNSMLPERVDGAVGAEEIAQLWQLKFSRVLNSVNDSQSKEEFLSRLIHIPNTPVEKVTVAEFQMIVKKLANNKAVGLDGIPNEFYKYAPLNILTLISILFNSFLNHCFLPSILMNVLIVPLLKNKLKDPSDSSNYRPIAIATAASKIFESILLRRLSVYLSTSKNQFGFKPNHSTELCVFALKEVVNYYRNLNTPIYLCFIDIKSAFDRVSYWKLFSKLIRRGVPLYALQILKYWYCNQSLCAGWGVSLSQSFCMSNGIRQGSLLSPLLFSVYVDDLNHRLNEKCIGCHIGDTPMNNLSYADDLVLLAPSPVAINELLNVCDKFAAENYIIFSTTKSVYMRILPKSSKLGNCPAVYLGGEKLSLVDSFSYLGHIIVSDFSDDEDIKKETRKLCYRGNSLVRKFKFCNVDVKCNLFKSFCYSLYCASLWSNFKQSTFQRLKVSYNNVMRRLMGVPTYNSASFLFGSLGVKSLKELMRSAQYSLMSRAGGSSPNDLILSLYFRDVRRISCIRQQWARSLFL